MEVINKMNTSNKNSKEVKKKIEEKLHHKNIWDYGTSAAIGLTIIVMMISGCKAVLFLKSQSRKIKETTRPQVNFMASESKIDNVFNRLSDEAKVTILGAARMGLTHPSAGQALYDNFKKVAMANDVELKREDMPENLLEIFIEKTLSTYMDRFNGTNRQG